MSVENQKEYDEAFSKKVHNVGQSSIAIAFLFSLSIPMYLTFVLGYVPSADSVISGLIFVASFVGIIWVVEPISYFPVLGAIGTYMSFLSGNIGNMRMPVVGAVQNGLELEVGTKKAEIAAVFGLVSSNIVNLVILFVVVVSGSAIVNALPEAFLAAFGYAVPGIFGAMIVSFARNMSAKHIFYTAALGLAVMGLVKMIGKVMPKFGMMLNVGLIGVAAVVVIIFAYMVAVKEKE